MIDLKPEKEPLIHAAIKRDALLENIVVDENGKCLYDDKSRTENTRGSSPTPYNQHTYTCKYIYTYIYIYILYIYIYIYICMYLYI